MAESAAHARSGSQVPVSKTAGFFAGFILIFSNFILPFAGRIVTKAFSNMVATAIPRVNYLRA